VALLVKIFKGDSAVSLEYRFSHLALPRKIATGRSIEKAVGGEMR
jgi:hypothetical protein